LDSPGASPGAGDRAGTVVIGGGLAGIAAALRSAELGREVTLLEARPRLGGAAFSFRRGELSVDNGQHVFLRCCTAYRWLLERLDATGQTVLQPHLDIPVLGPGGRTARLARVPGVPAPAHLGLSLARFGLLSPGDRVRAVRGALALRLLDPADPRLDDRSLGDYLRRHGQSPELVDALWGIVATATLNIGPDEASLALAAKVFRTGLLDSAPASDVGYARAPLGDLHFTAARRALAALGVTVCLGHRVESVSPDGEVHVRTREGEQLLRPGTVVLAVPPRDAFRMLPELADTPAAPARELGTSPIVNVHVVYDRPVTEHAFAAAVDSPVQWLFDRTDSSGVAARGRGEQYLAITVSAASEIIDTSSPVLIDRFVRELGLLLPRARGAEVVDAFVTRERHATFRQSVGSNARRPSGDVGLSGVYLAGSWTATGWPDTMESAVRSGVTAAEQAASVVSAGTGRASDPIARRLRRPNRSEGVTYAR
jgi:squalene-associated FAD-dependent desaturase